MVNTAKSQGAQVCISGRHARTIDFPLQRCITEQIDVQFSYSSAVNLFQNAIGLLLVMLANLLVKRISDSEEGILG